MAATPASTRVTYGLLGPLEVRDGDRALELAGGKQRALLALLLLHANEVVGTDRLVEGLWGESPPPTAAKALQGLVSQLRRTLAGERLLTRPPGYVLTVGAQSLDVARFRALADEGRRELEHGSPETAAARLRQALALWRGPPLVEFRYEQFAQDAIRGLEEARLGALEDRIDAELALGRHLDVIEELQELVASNPLRERLRAQLMLALYRSGRQAEALDTFRTGRLVLVDELGIEPGTALQRLHQGILAHDPVLDLPPVAPSPSRPPEDRRRQLSGRAVIVAAGVAGVAAAAVALLVGRADTVSVAPNSLVRIDPATNELVDVVRVGEQPDQVATHGAFVFSSNGGDDTVSRLDTRSGEVAPVGGIRSPLGLAADRHGLWVGSYSTNEVVRLDPETLAVERRLRLPGLAASLPALGAGSLWVTQGVILSRFSEPESVSRVLLPPGRPVRTYVTGRSQIGIAFGAGAAWVLNRADSTVTRIDARDGSTENFDVGHVATDVAFGFGSVWVASDDRGTVWRLNPASGRPEAIIPVGRGIWEVSAGASSVWVTIAAGGKVIRIDPRANRVSATIETGFTPHGVAAGAGGVWVAVAPKSEFAEKSR